MLFEQIRRDSRVEGLSVRALAKRHRVHRRTVRQALASAMPPEPARRRWQSRKIDPFVDAIDAMLRSDLTAPRKQRHTAVRVLDRFVDEHQATGLSYSTLRAYVAQRRREIWAEAGRPLAEVFVPQTHQPAAEGTAELAERRDMHIGKPAHDEIRLTGAAMPRPEQQPPPSRVEAVARSGASGHELSNAKNPAGAGCGFYIGRTAASGNAPLRQRFDHLVGFADHPPQGVERYFGLRRPFQRDEHRDAVGGPECMGDDRAFDRLAQRVLAT